MIKSLKLTSLTQSHQLFWHVFFSFFLLLGGSWGHVIALMDIKSWGWNNVSERWGNFHAVMSSIYLSYANSCQHNWTPCCLFLLKTAISLPSKQNTNVEHPLAPLAASLMSVEGTLHLTNTAQEDHTVLYWCARVLMDCADRRAFLCSGVTTCHWAWNIQQNVNQNYKWVI